MPHASVLLPRPLPRASRGRTPLSVVAFAAALSLSACSIPGLPGATGAPEPQRAVAAVRVSTSETVPSPTPDGTAAAATAEATAEATPTPTAAPAEAEADEVEAAAGPPSAVVPAVPEPAPAPAAAAWTAVPGDLAHGTFSRRIGTAAHTLVIDYWTTEDVAEWTPDSTPIINFNARIDGAATGAAVRVTRFNARVDALGLILADDQGSFAIEPPYAYSSALAVPGNPKNTSSKILFTIDLLTETFPGSGVFTRQTVMDALTIGYAKPGSVALSAAEKAR